MSLSGGQRARINLARAVYREVSYKHSVNEYTSTVCFKMTTITLGNVFGIVAYIYTPNFLGEFESY